MTCTGRARAERVEWQLRLVDLSAAVDKARYIMISIIIIIMIIFTIIFVSAAADEARCGAMILVMIISLL